MAENIQISDEIDGNFSWKKLFLSTGNSSIKHVHGSIKNTFIIEQTLSLGNKHLKDQQENNR